MNPRVTIAIPCFNAARLVAQAVQTALDQSWPDTETIVVDDGSTDGSLAALARFGDGIRIIKAEHRGGNAARNAAVRAATGEWIQFLDADDLLHPHKLANQFKEVTPSEADVIFSPVLFDELGWREAREIDASLDAETLWLAWQLPQTGGCLWRKSALESIGGWNEATSCCQEFELYLRAIQAGLRFRFAPTPGAIYRIWSGETLCRKDPRQVIEVRTQLYRQFATWLRERGTLTPERLAFAGRACFEMARTLAKLDLTEAVRYHDECKREQLIHVTGAAAPRVYRAAYRLFGFSFAEKLAASRRPRASPGI